MLPARRLSASLAATLAVAGTLGLATATSLAHAASASSETTLPGFEQVLVDKAAGHIFVSEGAGGGLAVTDLSGTLLTTLDTGTGVNGIAQSADGSELYAAIPGTDAVAEIDAASLQQTALYPLASGDVPYSVVVQSGKVWVSYQQESVPPDGGIGDITPGQNGSFEADPSLRPSTFWYSAPSLAADPSDSGTIVAVQEDSEPGAVVSLSVSGTPTIQATNSFFSACPGSMDNPAVMPGGAQFIVPCAQDSDVVYSTADLTAQAESYPSITSGYPELANAAAVSPDGAVATGARQLQSGTVPTAPDTFTFLPGQTSPRSSYTFGGSGTTLAPNGLAWSADDSVLAAVQGNPGGPYALQVITSPLQWSSTITLSPASASVVKGSPVTLSGTVSVASASAAAGTPVSVSRLNPDGTTTQIGGITTDAQGDFTVTDDTASATGTYTYTASVAATDATTSAQATAKVTVGLNKATLSLSGATTERPVLRFSIVGQLSYISGTPATGTAITVTRKGPSGSTTITGIKTGANGAFSIPQYISPLGSYTYTASVPATSTLTAASTTFKLTVAKAAPPLTVSTPAATALYNATINVTAHLGSTASNRTVSIYAQLVGSGGKKLLKTGKVNGSGNLAVSYPKATRNVIFTATFSGDTQYNGRSVSKRIGVDVKIAATYSGSSATAKYDGATYRVYHHTGTLVDKISVTPNKRGECIRLAIEALSGTQWVSGGDTSCFGLTSASTQVLDLPFGSVPYGHYRMEVLFQPSSKDETNVAYHTGWFYFQSEK